MTQADYTRKIDELNRLLNDPDVQLEPVRARALLTEVRQIAQPPRAFSDHSAS